MRFREEVLNVTVASLLTRRGIAAHPETIQAQRQLPDVLVDLDGLLLVIEGRDDRARRSLFQDARERIVDGVSDVSLALLYPDQLKEADSARDLERTLDSARYHGAVFYRGRGGAIVEDPFGPAPLDQIADLIRSAVSILVQDNVVQTHVSLVEAAIDEVVRQGSRTTMFFASDTLVKRLLRALGLPAPATISTRAIRRSEQDLIRIAAFILFDALLFHEVLSAEHEAITPPTRGTRPTSTFLEGEWRKILTIDYRPVFSIAIDVLASIPASPTGELILSKLVEVAHTVTVSGVLTRHDFMGRVYHKLLLRTTGKYYATYYTSIQAATLLATLQFRAPGDSIDASSVAALKALRIIDPACGSGTLLSAAYMALRDRHIVSRPSPLDMAAAHQALVEDALYGWDVLYYAGHLTLTTLALHATRALVSASHVYTLPVGMVRGRPYLGSLDYLKTNRPFRGYGFAESVEQQGLGGTRLIEDIPVPAFDAVIMNPPFSRSSRPKVKFGYSTPLARAALSTDLKRLARALGAPGLSVAGLGAFFMLLALRITKPGARIGMVIPRSMLSGVSWTFVREEYLRECDIEYVVSNFDPETKPGPAAWSWSENTNLGEVLVVARRRESVAQTDAPVARPDTTFVSVWRRPNNEVEALLLAHSIIARPPADDIRAGQWSSLGDPADPTGAAYRVAFDELKPNWLAPGCLAHPDLIAFGLNYRASSLPFRRLGDVATLGPDIAQIKGALEETTVATRYRVLWGQQAARNTLRLPVSEVGYGRPKKPNAVNLYDRASSVLLADRPHLSTEAILATSTPEPVLATAFWEVSLAEGQCVACFLLWFNSTYGFFEYVQTATSSRGDIYKGKSGQVVNLRMPQLSSHESCTQLLNRVAATPLLPFAKEFAAAANGAGVRRELDQFWAESVGAPPIDVNIYRLLAIDPVITHPTRGDEDDDGDDDHPVDSTPPVGSSARAAARSPVSGRRPPRGKGAAEAAPHFVQIPLLGEVEDLLASVFRTTHPRAGTATDLPGGMRLLLEHYEPPGLDLLEESSAHPRARLVLSIPTGGAGAREEVVEPLHALVEWLSRQRGADEVWLELDGRGHTLAHLAADASDLRAWIAHQA